MLRFLFGKPTGKQGDGPSPARQAPRPAPKPQAAAAAPDPIPLATRLADLAAHADDDPAVLDAALANGPAELREAALARIQDMDRLVRVACDSRSAEARHAAVLRISDEALLERIAHQARTRDKRVYKVARDRLDGYARERERHALQARWLETVEALAAQDHPELSRVVEVEKVWAALQPDAEADQRFQQARARLHARFQAQAEERRQARRQGAEGAAQAAPPADAPTLAVAVEAEVQAPLGPTGSGAAAGQGGEAAAVAGDSAAVAPQDAVDAGGAVDAGDAGVAEAAAGAASAPMAEAGVAHETPGADAAGGNGAATPPAQEGRRERGGGRRKAELDPELKAHIAQQLEALEHALEEGHLHDAETGLTSLSELQSQAGGVAGSLGGRIRHAAEEIARLRAWRRWGGQQARDHLCDEAEALPGRELPAEELGRAVKALRAQWQAIASSEGGAPQHLWERFDAACEKAWEPVREHFARQAERRSANLERREAMLVELEGKAASLDGSDVEWRTVAFALSDAARRWHSLGPVDRKLGKALEARYAAATGAIDRRLRAVRDAEAAERETLIQRAGQLSGRSEGRDVVAKLRELQAEWQTRSRAVPLERAREQALWERFRKTCDGLFQARDAARVAHDAERAAQIEAEQAVHRKRADTWRGLREAALACSAAERALAADATGPDGHAAIGAQLAAAWQALPQMAGRDIAPVQQRQQRLMAVCEGREAVTELVAGFAAIEAQVGRGLLELEIALGLPSPPELQDARRRLQLEKLADHLRSGGHIDHEGLHRPALALCALAAPRLELASRLDAILQALAPRAPERRPAAPPRGEGAPRRGEGERPARSQRPGRGRPAAAGRPAGARQPDA